VRGHHASGSSFFFDKKVFTFEKNCTIMVSSNEVNLKEIDMYKYDIGDTVWVTRGNCCGVAGVVVGFTKKRVKVYNEVTGTEGNYAPSSVKYRDPE
jgi:hypothetical protein